MRHIQIAALVCVAFFISRVSPAAPLFSDNFNTVASAASYGTITTDAVSSFATFAYDYSVMGIPSAPNSGDGSTKGLRLDANFSSPFQAEAITLYTLAAYSGDYTVQFDGWINVNGPFPDGGSGSTNYLGAGVGHNGTVNNFVANAGFGGWTAVNGENGSGIDYRLYKDSTLQGVATGQYAAGTGANARNGLNGYYDQFGNVNVSNFPVQGANNGGPAQQNGTSFKGAFGMQWHRVTLAVDADGGTGGAASVKWFIDNLPIGTLDAGANGAFTSNGSVAFSYSDPTSNGSDNPPLSFVLIDNFQIVPEPTTCALGVIGIALLCGWGRRRS
jgi:PEP-CTERM motif-containing protein